MADDTPYVPTKAIVAAVEGAETEVLDKLGIEWRRGRPHITCPYRDHADHDQALGREEGSRLLHLHRSRWPQERLDL
jgi:hypothetical protein